MIKQQIATLPVLFSLILFYHLVSSDLSEINLCDSETLAKSNITAYRYKNTSSTYCDDCDFLCIRKCCAKGFYIKKGNCAKLENKSNFQLPIYDYEVLQQNVDNPNSLVIGVLRCDFHPLNKYENEKFYLQENGSLWVPSFEKFYSNEEYCVDYTLKENLNFDLTAFICYEDDDTPIFLEAYHHTSSGMIISMPFLFVTFMVYAVLPERNLHMKAMMSYVATLLIAYIILVTIQLSNTNFPAAVCTLLGFACAFFFMVSFFWMNVICIDVWFGFRGFRTRGSGETKRFLLYSLYAWGMPIVLVFIIFLLQTFGEPDSWYHPGIGTGQCFIKTGAPYNLYFYLPIAILIILNVVFFVSTALKIRSIKKDTAVLKREDSRKHSYENDKQQFNLYLKLLLAMGINWTMEIISGIVMQKFKSIPTWIWYLTDFCNASYGVFIFFIFVCKRNIWLQVKRRYYTFMGKPYRAHQTYPTKTTSMSTSHTTHSIVESQADSMALSQRSSHNA